MGNLENKIYTHISQQPTVIMLLGTTNPLQLKSWQLVSNNIEDE